MKQPENLEWRQQSESGDGALDFVLGE